MTQGGGWPAEWKRKMQIRPHDKVRIREGWDGAGREGIACAMPFHCNAQEWVPVIWLDRDDPSLFKTAGLQVETLLPETTASAERAANRYVPDEVPDRAVRIDGVWTWEERRVTG